MKLFTAIVLSCLAMGARAQSPGAALSDATAKNLALVSASLQQHQAGLDDQVKRRVELILSVHKMSIGSRMSIERERNILAQTDGQALLKLFDALAEHGDNAAQVPARSDALLAQARAEIEASFAPIAISTAKLDEAAMKLTVLAQEQTAMERAASFRQFFKDVMAANEKAQADSEQKKADGNQSMDKTVADAGQALSAAKTSK